MQGREDNNLFMKEQQLISNVILIEPFHTVYNCQPQLNSSLNFLELMDLNFSPFFCHPAKSHKAFLEDTTVHVIVHTWTSAIQVLLASSVCD